MTDILNLDGVQKLYHANSGVRDIHINLQKGSTYGLIGMNGAGKTTIIRLILNHLKADKGAICWKGNTLKENDYLYKQSIGYIPDDDAAFEMLTIKEAVEFVGYSYGLNKETLEKRLNMLLKVTELEGENRLIGSFSRGMKKKVQIISALLSKPELLILDEPIAGLDPQMIYKLKRILKEYVLQNNATILLSTHDLAIAQEVCDYIFMIHKGVILYQDTVENIIENYNSLEYAFLQKTNQIPLEEQLINVVSNF